MAWPRKLGRSCTVAKAAGLPELFVPRSIRHASSVPLLGTGKIDYVSVTRLASTLALASQLRSTLSLKHVVIVGPNREPATCETISFEQSRP